LRLRALALEVPGDVLEHYGYAPFAQNAKAFITSRFENVFGLKNENRELEMYYMGEIGSKSRRIIRFSIPKMMFEDGEGKQLQRGRFGLMCFSANRN
jgi:hypothetical protein